MSLADQRPRSVAEIVDATFRLYRAHFPAILTVAMIVVAPPSIIKALVPAEFERLVDFIGNLFLPIGQGAITAIVVAAVERGASMHAGDALRSTGGRADSLVAVQIASGLMVFIGLILLVIPGVIALAWTAVCVPVVMIEHVGYSRSIDRSRALGKGRWRHVLGTLALAWTIGFLLIIGAGALMGLAGIEGRIAKLGGDILFGVVIPIPAIAMTFLYYDLRIRTESADLDAMISALPAPETVHDV